MVLTIFLALLSRGVLHIHTICISFDRSPHNEQLCLTNHCCQLNCSLIIQKYVQNLLLRTSLCYFSQSPVILILMAVGMQEAG